MVDEEDFAKRWKEGMLQGDNPQTFIRKQVANLTKAMEKAEGGETPVKVGNGDVAYITQFWIDQGAVAIEEISDVSFLQSLGLTAEEAKVFVPETLPEIQQLMKEEELHRAQEAENANREYATQFTDSWGLKRIDEIGEYYMKNPKKLDEADRYWQAGIARFQNQREQLGKQLEEITDPIKKAQFVMRQAYHLTYLHPSELQQIYNAEKQSSSHPYLDSLLNTSVAMSKNLSPKDPDFDSVQVSSGNVSMSVSFFRADDPESMRNMRRGQTLEALTFGAKKTNETMGVIKPKIYPLARRASDRGPSA